MNALDQMVLNRLR